MTLVPEPRPEYACENAALELCASYVGADGVSNMALLEIKMVTGWVPDKKTLEKARNRKVWTSNPCHGNCGPGLGSDW